MGQLEVARGAKLPQGVMTKMPCLVFGAWVEAGVFDSAPNLGGPRQRMSPSAVVAGDFLELRKGDPTREIVLSDHNLHRYALALV